MCPVQTVTYVSGRSQRLPMSRVAQKALQLESVDSLRSHVSVDAWSQVASRFRNSLPGIFEYCRELAGRS